MQQQQDNQKNLLLAIVLSVGVLLAWQVFYAGPKLKDEQERKQRIQQEAVAKGQQPASTPGSTTPGVATPPGKAGSVPGASTQPQALTREEAVKSVPRVAVDTPSLKGSVSLKGGRIDDLVLAKYHETVDRKSPNVVLFQPSTAPHPYYAEYGWVATQGSSVAVPGSDTTWTQQGSGALTPTNPIVLTWDNGGGLLFKRTISVDADYLFTVVDQVDNKTSGEVTLYPYALISRHGMPKVEGFYILHEGLIGILGDAGLKEITYADVIKDGGSKSFKDKGGGWIGMTDKYWAAALIPDQQTAFDASLSGSKRNGREFFQTDYTLPAVTMAPGATGTAKMNLFAGAKQVEIIDTYQAKLNIKQFGLMIDWGMFWFFTRPLFTLLHYFANLLGNYGLAVLAVTVLVKAAFFPLANKSYESMAKMKKLQPEMEKIRERFKDDRVKQQQELMALYKNEKINPAAGCLPVLLQIPVFFALYKVLFITIDMRHAPFFGWIKDLSAPDPTSLFNLFGLLPYAVPDYFHVGAWPIIMGITMWVQMQLNPQQPDPVQQKIFNWMPVIFTFMLASFPSGLVIYWAWNNVLSLLQQYHIMRRNNTEVHLWKNIGVDQWKSRYQAVRNIDPGKVRQGLSDAASRIRKK